MIYQELLSRFEAYSLKEGVRGTWLYQGTTYEDQNQVLSVVTLDTKANRQWLSAMKETLKQRFQQIDIFMKIVPVDLI